MLEPGRVIGEHRIGAQLGEGPLAATWHVEDAEGRITGVLRILLLRLSDFRTRFQRSAEVLLGREHPNLVTLREIVEIDGLLGVITEHVRGGNLKSWMAEGDRSPGRIVPMFHDIAVGIGAAHDAGLLHRNLKPSKILITETGVPKVAGFALGKITAPQSDTTTEIGTTFGTPQYMPPEQFRGVANVDQRADLFALGCVLYEMLSGQRAFEGTDMMEIYRASVLGDYPPLPAGIPVGLVGIVADLMDPDPDLRPATIAALLDRLHEDREVRALLPTVRAPIVPMSSIAVEPTVEWSTDPRLDADQVPDATADLISYEVLPSPSDPGEPVPDLPSNPAMGPTPDVAHGSDNVVWPTPEPSAPGSDPVVWPTPEPSAPGSDPAVWQTADPSADPVVWQTPEPPAGGGIPGSGPTALDAGSPATPGRRPAPPMSIPSFGDTELPRVVDDLGPKTDWAPPPPPPGVATVEFDEKTPAPFEPGAQGFSRHPNPAPWIADAAAQQSPVQWGNAEPLASESSPAEAPPWESTLDAAATPSADHGGHGDDPSAGSPPRFSATEEAIAVPDAHLAPAQHQQASAVDNAPAFSAADPIPEGPPVYSPAAVAEMDAENSMQAVPAPRRVGPPTLPSPPMATPVPAGRAPAPPTLRGSPPPSPAPARNPAPPPFSDMGAPPAPLTHARRAASPVLIPPKPDPLVQTSRYPPTWQLLVVAASGLVLLLAVAALVLVLMFT